MDRISIDWSHVPDRKAFERKYDRRLFDLGVSAYAGVGVDVELNPFELLDFFLGFAGIDIAGYALKRIGVD